MARRAQPVPLLPGEGVIRCPAMRSLVHANHLAHADLQTAAVQELIEVLSGERRPLRPNEPGSLANIAGFFAIFNHDASEPPRRTTGLAQRLRNLFSNQDAGRIRDAAAVAAGQIATDRRFSLRLFGSRGDHPGTVNFFRNDEAGEFQPEQFASVMSQIADGETLTLRGIAKMILMANEGRWDEEGSTFDLAKSSGEWALMVCVLRSSKSSTDMAVSDLHDMYSQAETTKLLEGASRATALEWVDVTARIAAAIAAEKGQAVFFLGSALHTRFKAMNGANSIRLCPCNGCNPQMWSA